MIVQLPLILSIVIQSVAVGYMVRLFIGMNRDSILWFILCALFLLLLRFGYDCYLVLENRAGINGYSTEGSIDLLIAVLTLSGIALFGHRYKKQGNLTNQKPEQEKEVLSAIMKTEENERARFAKELHDGLGPLLSSVKMSVSVIKKQMGAEVDHRIIDNTEKLIDESIFTIKEISNNISPHILNNFGLYKALQSFINKVQVGNPINIILNCNLEGKRYNYNVEVVFYRVICELINNTLKHASAHKITIDFFEDKDELLLEYFDDGIGFSVEKAELAGQGMGLANMKSRISSLNGSFQMKSRTGNGVCFTIRVRLN